jgi:hypothetical protein
MTICEHCGMPYTPRMRTQRFCNSVCSQEFFTAERRLAVQALRAETSTYHGREAEAEGPGGRFAAEAPRVGWHDQPGPEWADQCVGDEPPVDGRGEGTETGYAIDQA